VGRVGKEGGLETNSQAKSFAEKKKRDNWSHFGFICEGGKKRKGNGRWPELRVDTRGKKKLVEKEQPHQRGTAVTSEEAKD